MNSVAQHDFGVLLLSCDKYADLWPITLSQFHKNFCKVNYPVYFGSNEIPVDNPGVISVLSGADRDWSSSYARILEQIPCRKLFVLLDDLLIASPIDSAVVEQCVRFILTHDATHIKWLPKPQPDRVTDNELIWEYDRGAPYRASVCGFWDREQLLQLLIPGESPWNFEIMGSYRTSYSDGYYAVAKPLFECVHVIEKGCWISESVTWAEKNNVCFDLAQRPILTGRRGLVSRLQTLWFNIMLRVPWRIRVNLMSKLRKALVSY
jgi:hypothetical protein